MDTGDRIRLIFLESLAIDVPSPSTDIIDTGLLDSLSLVTLLFEIEQVFEIRIPMDALDIDSLRSIERIEAFVVGLRATV